MSYEIEAIFSRLQTDDDGESTLSFKVPYKDLAKALAVSALIKRILVLDISEQGESR